jgi:hypothetical protein
MKERAVSSGGQGPRLVGRPVAGCGLGGFGGAPVIHPVALGGPVCGAVLGGSIKTAAVLCWGGQR